MAHPLSGPNGEPPEAVDEVGEWAGGLFVPANYPGVVALRDISMR
jgi:hypothetical protein